MRTNLTNPQTLNLYSMVGDDPESFADLDGHFSNGYGGPWLAGPGLFGGPSFVDAAFFDNDGGPSGPGPGNIPGGIGYDKNAYLTGLAEVGQNTGCTNATCGDYMPQKAGSSGGNGFWSHVRNLLHGHSWNYGMRESVTTRILTVATDLTGLAGAVLKNGKLGAASSIVSIMTDPSPKNIAITGLGSVPGLDVPVAVGSVAWDGSKFAAEVIGGVFTPDASQAKMIDDGYGHSIPNPARMDEDLCQAYGACN